MAVWRLGLATFLHQPGELLAEIVNCTVQLPKVLRVGLTQTIESLPLREQMPGESKLITSLSYDFSGNILPKRQ
ncbi:MAG: hypothetical protein MUE95_08485 [Cyclobacteriaceae bacterium]|jgi:hypothetical protein|nr:hypothetical protein [Cyclobacteriaceae bacterium]